MRSLDGVRRVAGMCWCLVGAVAGVAGVVTGQAVPGAISATVETAVIALTVIVWCSAGTRVTRWTGTAVAVALGITFLGAVADRFGVFGGPGDPGVSWGNWETFVRYSGDLLPFVSPPFVLAAAMAATLVEVILGAALIVGWQRRWIGKTAAGLLVTYLVAMATTVGIWEAIRYGVPILVGGALLVSAIPARAPRARARAGTFPADAL